MTLHRFHTVQQARGNDETRFILFHYFSLINIVVIDVISKSGIPIIFTN